MSRYDLLPALEPRLDYLVQRHKEAAGKIDWSYYDYLPLDEYHATTSRERPLSPVAYGAVETALLTEVNLPWYTATIFEYAKSSLAPIQEFARLWTAEEDQHATLLETYLLLTDNGDREKRRLLRKSVLNAGWPNDLAGPFEGMVYTTIQETQTRAFYNHAAIVCEENHSDLARALRRIAKDETLHAGFYRDAVKAHLEYDPGYLKPLSRVMMSFRMPGYVIPDYEERHTYLTKHVFGPQHYWREVIEPLCAYWRVDDLSAKSQEGEAAARELRVYRAALRRMAKTFERSRSPGSDRSSAKTPVP